LRTEPHAARHQPTLRSVIFRYRDITAFSAALESAQGGSLTLPEGETVTDGEWVLAIFEIGSRRRATAAAARGVRAAGDPHLAFERRDWDRLQSFVAARSEHMRAARIQRGTPSSSGRIAAAAPSGPPPSVTVPPATYDTEPPPSSVIDSMRVPFAARVLLVDDDPATRDEVRRMLADIGLVVEAVETAAEATARMDEVVFDALVLDFHAQGMDPLDFVRAVRRDPERAPLPVLFLSERPSSRDAVDAFASGADDFLPKPFRAPELGARVFGLLRRARLARYSIGPNSSGPRSSRGGSFP